MNKSIINKIKSLRERTCRAGFKWTNDEDAQLMKEAQDGLEFDDIATKHQRTISAVKLRVMSNGLKMMTESNLTLSEVSTLIHISEEELLQYKQREDDEKMKQKAKQEKTQNKKLNTFSISDGDTITQDIVSILSDIRDYLKIISEKSTL